MTSHLRIRPAARADCAAIAGFVLEAGGGLFEFLFEGVLPVSPAEVVSHMVGDTTSLFAFPRCWIAATDDDAAAGLLNCYPADCLRLHTFDSLPAERVQHVAAFRTAQDWGSFYVSALAVAPARRRIGIGRALLDYAVAEARRLNHPRVSLHVWADNDDARRLYENCGFAVLTVADIEWHPRLPHHGGLLLMSRPVEGDARP
jgi:ribosomal protein S18 acetylase RimI-like enzyme